MFKELELVIFLGIVICIIYAIYKGNQAFKNDNKPPRQITTEELNIDALIDQLKTKIQVAASQAQMNVDGAQARLDKYNRDLANAQTRKEQFKNL